MTVLNRIFRCTLGLIAAAALSACATNQPVANNDAQESDKELRVVTGSRIEQEIDPESESPATRQPVRIVDRDELDRRGAVNLDDALRRSVPQLGH